MRVWATSTLKMYAYIENGGFTLRFKKPKLLLQISQDSAKKSQATRNTKITTIYEAFYTDNYKSNKASNW